MNIKECVDVLEFRLLAKWVFQQASCEKVDDANFPLVKIDRTTVQNLLPIFMNRGIFSDYAGLKTKKAILKQAAKRLSSEVISKNLVLRLPRSN